MRFCVVNNISTCSASLEATPTLSSSASFVRLSTSEIGHPTGSTHAGQGPATGATSRPDWDKARRVAAREIVRLRKR